LNDRVYLFGRRRDLQTLLAKYAGLSGQDVIELQTEAVLRFHESQIQLADQNTGAVARKPSPQKFRNTFREIGDFDQSRPVKEITIVGGLSDVGHCVSSVVRHHPNGTKEVLV
jgi:hypothetical protein